MDIDRLRLLVHTLKYLRFKQIYYRLYYFVRNRLFTKQYDTPLQTPVAPLLWKDGLLYPNSFFGQGSFVFLNLQQAFQNKIDWNFTDHGKLWTYNLNYFDFLNQEEISKESGLRLIHDFIDNASILKDAKEPYPISLRSINWVKFLSKNRISDNHVNQFLCNDFHRLADNLEFHLLGNHLLENGFSLFFGAHYFRNDLFYRKAKAILIRQLKEQVLKDGAHFELSPMYHQIMVHRLLDCIQLTGLNSWKSDKFNQFLIEKALQMLSWLETATYLNGNIPMVNDSAYHIAPTSHQLFAYAKNLNLNWGPGHLSDSGYRKFSTKRYELFVDVGRVGPKYQPGHAHADTFNFELYVNGNPLIVDTGISTYEKNKLRNQQRGTASHNTVMVNETDQSQVWGGFRVAKRANIVGLKEDGDSIEATHTGYKSLGILHTRKFKVRDSEIIISDTLSKGKAHKQTAFLHFHPAVGMLKIDPDLKGVTLSDKNVHIGFEGNVIGVKKETYRFALGFNRTVPAEKLVIDFSLDLRKKISFRRGHPIHKLTP